MDGNGASGVLIADDQAPTVEGVLKQCIMLLYIHEKLSAEEAERLIAELGLKHA